VKGVAAATGAGVLTLAVLSACGSGRDETSPTPSPSGTTASLTTPSPTAARTPTDSGSATSDSATSDQDALRAFFGLIDAGRSADAADAMSSSAAGDDARRQAWAVQFDAITSVALVSATPSAPEEWTESRHTYKVLLDLAMDPASADAPIPYYGYEDGRTVRWVTLVDEAGAWKIDAIATGP
jgi:hypothetical protein